MTRVRPLQISDLLLITQITSTKWTLRCIADFFSDSSDSWLKGKGSPYSITERRVLELIPVLGSQPAGDVSHKPGGGLPLISPATLKRAATNFAAWWTEAHLVWAVCLRLLPDSVATAIWTRVFCAWVQHANHSATEPATRESWLVAFILSNFAFAARLNTWLCNAYYC